MELVGHRLALILQLSCMLFLLIHTQPIRADDEEDHLLEGINSYRQSLKVPPLVKNDKANCVADQIAGELEDRKCSSNASPPPPMQPQVLGNYTSIFNKCRVDINSTRDGVILPVCVPHRVATLVLTNYTQSQNSRYVNDSTFAGAGIATDNDWTILVLTTNTPGGSFTSIGHRIVIGSGWCLAFHLLMIVRCFVDIMDLL